MPYLDFGTKIRIHRPEDMELIMKEIIFGGEFSSLKNGNLQTQASTPSVCMFPPRALLKKKNRLPFPPFLTSPFSTHTDTNTQTPSSPKDGINGFIGNPQRPLHHRRRSPLDPPPASPTSRAYYLFNVGGGPPRPTPRRVTSLPPPLPMYFPTHTQTQGRRQSRRKSAEAEIYSPT